MTRTSPFNALASALACALLAGCNLAPHYQAPRLPVPDSVAPPLAQGASAMDAVPLAEAGPMQWQDFVQEPRLRELVGLALEHNRDLRLALLAIDKARAQYGVARADRLPSVNASGAGSLITRQFLPPEFADNYIFRVSANDSLQAQVIVDEAVTRRGLQRLAIFHDATNYGVLGSEDLTTALHQRGLTAVIIERFQLGETDMGPALRRARQADAEAVLTYGIGPELAQIANDLARLNWRVPIIGSWTLAMSSFIDRAGPNAEGARMPQTFIQEATNPARGAFLAAWQQATGVARIPVPPAAAQGYDSMLLLAQAISQANSLEGRHIREALEDLRTPVQGVIMTYLRPYARDQHETLTHPQQIHMGEVRDGRVVFAYAQDRQRAMQS